MRCIALTNQKGGVGKTTSAVNLGACLAELGKTVLAVDIDPQANLSLSFGIDVRKIKFSIYDLLINRAALDEVLQKTQVDGLDIIPSHIDLVGAEVEIIDVSGREMILKNALAPIKGNYDYILIDCPPSLGFLTLNALTFAKEVFIPLQTEFFALYGVSQLLDTVNKIRRRFNSMLEITGVIPCLFDSRTNLSREVLEDIKKHFKGKVFRTVIRKNVRLAESPSYGKPIIIYDPYAAGASDYMALAKEVIAQERKARKHSRTVVSRATPS